MKILETQNALLSNYEVYQHLVDQQQKNKTHKRRVPGNFATLRTEVLTYLRQKPSPLAKQEETGAYSPEAIPQLLEKIQQEFPNELAKGELLMMLNIRPPSTAVLSTVIENMEDRFTEDQQNRLVEIIAEVLGRDEPAAPSQEDEDAMESIENGH